MLRIFITVLEKLQFEVLVGLLPCGDTALLLKLCFQLGCYVVSHPFPGLANKCKKSKQTTDPLSNFVKMMSFYPTVVVSTRTLHCYK